MKNHVELTESNFTVEVLSASQPGVDFYRAMVRSVQIAPLLEQDGGVAGRIKFTRANVDKHLNWRRNTQWKACPSSGCFATANRWTNWLDSSNRAFKNWLDQAAGVIVAA